MLLAALFALSTSELRLELVRESLTGAHCRYREYVAGIATEDYRVVPCSGNEKAGVAAPSALRIVEGRVLRRAIVEERPLMPFAHDYDATTGALVRRVPLFFNAKSARVFDPNPVVALNDPSLQDTNDSAGAVPEAAYRDVELPDEALHGPWVTLVDRQPRNVAPPEGALRFHREEDGFEDVSAWFHLDRNQRYLQSLGYTGTRGVVPYAIEVDAHATNGADNSFFLPSAIQTGRGTLYFGEGGTDDAEDADLLVHEYMHAIIEWIAPGTFGGLFASEARALAEGMGDYWAFSAHEKARRASARDPFCFADWDARCWLDDPSQNCAYPPGTDCLRRLDSTRTMADFETGETAGVEHRNGAIWSSALREIHDAIGREAADSILIESLFEAPPRPTFATMAQRLLEADRLLYGNAHAGAICSAMYTRGIVTQCDITARGERTLVQSTDFGLPIPENSTTGVVSTIDVADSRAIEKLFVRVDIDHSARGDLRVELTAPDGTVFLLHQTSSSRAAGIHETYGLTAMPVDSLDSLRGRNAAGRWTLTVFDLRPIDTGVLRSWGLEIQFAGDRPATSRPRSPQSHTIPVAGHVYGIDGAWTSSLRILNALDSPQAAILVFTPTGEDGETSFAAVQVTLAPGQTLAFEDVVRSVFHTTGSGAIEILGPVLATARMDLEGSSGILSEQVPRVAPENTKSIGAGPLVVAPMPGASRCNIGVVEIAGREGIVRVRQGDGTGEIRILPHSHVQFGVAPARTEVEVVGGSAVVAAYLSEIDAGSGDAMFVPAETADAAHGGIAPAIRDRGAGWRSDFWADAAHPAQLRIEALPGGSLEIAVPASYVDVLSRLFPASPTVSGLAVTRPAGVFAASRIAHGNTTQFVPFLPLRGPAVQHILFVENSGERRTNVGIVSAGPADAEAVVYDAAGHELERLTLATDGGVAQRPVRADVVTGRIDVRFLTGQGSAYASVIDLGSGDATFFAGE